MERVPKFVIAAREFVGPYLKNGPTILFVILSSLLIDNIYLSGFLSSIEQIEIKYGVSFATSSWTLSAYAVTYGSFIAIFGRISDIIGHHIMLVLGLFAFAVLSLVTALVENIYVLIVFRALQGMCAAATVPPSFGIVAHSFKGRALKIVLGIMNTLLIVSFGFGLIIGGALGNTKIGYRALCWIAAGYSFIACFLAILIVDPIKGDHTASLKRLDYFGVLILAAGGVLLVTGFTEAGSNWSSPAAYVPIITGGLLFVAFIAWEKLFFKNGRGESVSMMIPTAMWSVINFKPIPVINFLLYAGFMTIYFAADEYFEFVYGDSGLIAAVRMLPFVGSMVFSAFAVVIVPPGTLSTRTMCISGIAVGFAGIVLVSQAKLDTSYPYWRYYFPGAILFGAGSNFYFVNYMNMIVLATPLEMQALISGICLTAGQVGSAVGLAVTTSILGDSNTTLADKKALSDIYQNVFYFSVASYAVVLILIILFVKNLRPEDMKQALPRAGDAPSAEEMTSMDGGGREKSSLNVPQHSLSRNTSNV